MAESGVISFDYLRSLFITQKVSKNGYYKYFVKRNGEYFIEQCDDYIPVEKKTWKPIWGIDLKHPWQVILMKMWIKEMGGVKST